MKKLLLALLFVPTLAAAEYVPNGCYVSFVDTTRCWRPSDGIVNWTQSPNRDTSAGMYGSTMGAIVYSGYLCDEEKVACASTLASCKANALLTENNRQEWITYGNGLAATNAKNLALIKKLRRACGTKCKKVK